MRAIVFVKYGPPEVLQLREVEKPVTGKDEVCIKIAATSVAASDCIVRGFKLPFWNPIGFMMGLVLGFGKPRNPILGMVLAGVVESVGREALTADGKYQSVDNGSPKGTVENLKLLKQLAETGAIRPVIDRCYPLEQIVEAHRYVDRGHKKGNVVITIGHDE